MPDDYLYADESVKEHMRATVKIRELGLQNADVTRRVYEEIVSALRLLEREDPHAKGLADGIKALGDDHVKDIKSLAEAEYQCRLKSYVLAAMVADPTLKATDAFPIAEAMVLEAAVGV